MNHRDYRFVITVILFIHSNRGWANPPYPASSHHVRRTSEVSPVAQTPPWGERILGDAGFERLSDAGFSATNEALDQDESPPSNLSEEPPPPPQISTPIRLTGGTARVINTGTTEEYRIHLSFSAPIQEYYVRHCVNIRDRQTRTSIRGDFRPLDASQTRYAFIPAPATSPPNWIRSFSVRVYRSSSEDASWNPCDYFQGRVMNITSN